MPPVPRRTLPEFLEICVESNSSDQPASILTALVHRAKSADRRSFLVEKVFEGNFGQPGTRECRKFGAGERPGNFAFRFEGLAAARDHQQLAAGPDKFLNF